MNESFILSNKGLSIFKRMSRLLLLQIKFVLPIVCIISLRSCHYKLVKVRAEGRTGTLNFSRDSRKNQIVIEKLHL